MHVPEPTAHFVRRTRLILVFFWLGLVAVGLRAAQLQIDQHVHLTQLAQDQYLNTVKIPARRGHIYDRNGTPLAVSVEVPSVFANPAAIDDAKAVARRLAPILGLNEKVLHDKLASERYFVWLKRQISPDVAEEVKSLGLSGVNLTKEPKRFYPNREVGAQVIGFAGMDGRGLEGIEKQLDAALVGQPQIVAAMRDARGRAVLEGGLDPMQRARGQDVHLTLDLQIQHAAEQALARVVQSTHAKNASAVVMDVATAEILAMAVVPTYNPNGAAREQAELRRNRIVTDVYEPGSTLKPLVVGAALDAKAVTPKTKIFCENGKFKIGKHTINDTSPHAELTLTEVIAKSSNIGMAKIAQAMGKLELEDSLRRFGMGTRSGVEFPGEVMGVLRPSANWSELETATIAFGQGMAVNGLQLAAAYRVLAAQGAYRTPRLVKAMEQPNGALQLAPQNHERPVLSLEAARRVTAMLEAASGPAGGTGRLAAVPGYRVAGKTGTAQKADPLTGSYSRDRYIAIFAGFLPADAPQVVITVAVDEPMTNHYGGVVAAPVFADIGAATMQRMGIVASGPSEEELAAMVAGQPAKTSRPITTPTVTPVAAGAVKVQPTPLDVQQPGEMPSFLGLSSRQAVERFVAAQIHGELNMQGSGTVVRQSPSPGTKTAELRETKLVLAP